LFRPAATDARLVAGEIDDPQQVSGGHGNGVPPSFLVP
jgi:hypothetical protein